LQEDIRLSSNLDDEDFTAHINNQTLRLGDDKINDVIVIAIDPGDIMKPYAKAMEKLCGIWDVSKGAKQKGTICARLQPRQRPTVYPHLF
jgi:hypothetical protein